MRRYETVFITKPDMDEELRKNIAEKVKAVVTSASGNVQHLENFGKQKMAFEVDGETKGCYHYLAFEGTHEMLKEVERQLRLQEFVLSFQSIVIENAFDPKISFYDRSLRPTFKRGRGKGEFGRYEDAEGGADDGAHEGAGDAAMYGGRGAGNDMEEVA